MKGLLYDCCLMLPLFVGAIISALIAGQFVFGWIVYMVCLSGVVAVGKLDNQWLEKLSTDNGKTKGGSD